MIGENPNGIPNNLMPFVAQVAIEESGRNCRCSATITRRPASTGVRDYIHVVDLAQGHLAALAALARSGQSLTVNLGTGQGYSVLDAVRAFEAASGRPVPYQIVARRAGDIATCYADPQLAEELLGWQAGRGISEMCADAWRWRSMNRTGCNAGAPDPDCRCVVSPPGNN